MLVKFLQLKIPLQITRTEREQMHIRRAAVCDTLKAGNKMKQLKQIELRETAYTMRKYNISPVNFSPNLIELT